MCFLWVFFIFVRQEGGSFYEVLFFCLGASFLVLVGGAAAVDTLPLLVRFPHLALMGILTPVWVVVLWTIAERTHVYLCVFWLRFVLDAGYTYVIIWVETVSIFFDATLYHITVNTVKWYT